MGAAHTTGLQVMWKVTTFNVPGIYNYTEQKDRNAPQSLHEVVHYLKVFLIHEVTLLAAVLGSCAHWGKAEQ